MKSRPRLMWKTFHRSQRVAAREIGKAYQDLLIFGTGATLTGDVEINYGPVTKRELIRHVHLGEIAGLAEDRRLTTITPDARTGVCRVRAVRNDIP